MSIRLSYIIPICNGEKYLNRCLDSIYMQGLEESVYEILCIDDCSMDSSVSILNDYAKCHSNIKLILHDHNKRTSNSCNEGLQIAKGKYMMFLGQDDWLEKGWGRN